MRKIIRILGILILLVLLIGCATARYGNLVEDGVSEAYIKQNLGEMAYKGVGFLTEENFNTHKRLFREGIVADTKMSDQEKQNAMARMSELTFEEDRYLGFSFGLKEPALVNQREYDFILNDKNGKTVINKVLMYDNKSTTTITTKYTHETYIRYNYIWILQLKKPFTKDYYESEVYPFTVVFPNGEQMLYEVEI